MDDFFPDWDDLNDIKGIGPKTIETIKEFCDSDDPLDWALLENSGYLRQDFSNNRPYRCSSATQFIRKLLATERRWFS